MSNTVYGWKRSVNQQVKKRVERIIFFQAEDGIRDIGVTGVQTCALPISARYPWLEFYTPVNEPCTTARFAGLYGVWYPHARDDKSFIQALLIQCRAVVLSMQIGRASCRERV